MVSSVSRDSGQLLPSHSALAQGKLLSGQSMQTALHRERGTDECRAEGHRTRPASGAAAPRQYPSHFGNTEGNGRNEPESAGGKLLLYMCIITPATC